MKLMKLLGVNAANKRSVIETFLVTNMHPIRATRSILTTGWTSLVFFANPSIRSAS